MSDVACHCGRRGALLARQDNSLYRWHECREHLDQERIKLKGLKNSVVPPVMPVIFLDTDIDKLHPRIKDSLDWTPTGDVTGLLFHGVTGVGKTRGIWEIVKKLWSEKTLKDRQLDFKFLTMRKLEGLIEKSFEERSHAGMIDSLIETELLVLDDFGKERLTQRMASDLFSVIDERSTGRRATIISTNFNGSTLLERFDGRDKETGNAMIRRFKDYYRIVGINT
jgi:DNA replication protein DnaC